MAKISPCVQVLIDAFEGLDPVERRKVVRELEGLCIGYKAGLDDVWLEMLAVDDGEFVRKHQAYDALAHTMSDAGILHHRGRGCAPKGWG